MATLSTLQKETISGLKFIESDIPNTVLFKTVNYPAITSISMTERTLENGGFVIDKTLSATIRIYNSNGSSVFTNDVLPQTQEKLTYDGDVYRILQVKVHPQNTHIRIIAINDTRGI